MPTPTQLPLPANTNISEKQYIEWVNSTLWLDGADIVIEHQQLLDEGRTIPTALERSYQSLIATEKKYIQLNRPTLSTQRNSQWHTKALQWIDAAASCKPNPKSTHNEPSTLPEIRQASQRTPALQKPISKKQLLKHIHGALAGRAAGCLLGKPVEEWTRRCIETTARATNNWPLNNYFSCPTPAQDKLILSQKPIFQFTDIKRANQLLPNIHYMPSDDDLNYTLTGYSILKKHGTSFTPLHVAHFWISNIPLLSTCTAERVAYRNFATGILPPLSATIRNPYREWIGAQIRADFYGWANIHNPKRATEWAWRDASISHTKNGIYGSLWIAALLSLALQPLSWHDTIAQSITWIPKQSRLASAISQLLALHSDGASYEQSVQWIHSHWNERSFHHWCHTIPNALIVCLALLWGEDDYSKTITRAVMAAFDTDCNGATSGSIWGLRHGIDHIPSLWLTPLNDTLRSNLNTMQSVSISQLASEMATWIHENKA